MPWAPSHPFHAMPPRITRNSYRPRASDRTMVDLESPFACRSRKLDGIANSPEETHQNGHKSNFSQRSLIPVGWISRKHLASGRGRTFFLTSLFIELIERDSAFERTRTKRAIIRFRRTPVLYVIGNTVRPERFELSTFWFVASNWPISTRTGDLSQTPRRRRESAVVAGAGPFLAKRHKARCAGHRDRWLLVHPAVARDQHP